MYDIASLERFVIDGVVSIPEVREAKAVKALGDLAELMWVRKMQAARSAMKVG